MNLYALKELYRKASCLEKKAMIIAVQFTALKIRVM